ncbi:MAG: hypothetical protein JO112_19645 [Planctomycetes bacterium]|nr:hypothetical protein [Planctomycetota bacterium]
MTGLVLAISAGLFVLPSLARGSCGDYVLRNGVASQPGMVHSSSDSSQPRPDHRPCPCRGPNCSQGPRQVPLSPVSSAPAPDDECAFLLASPVLPLARESISRPGQSSLHPLNHSFRIERPPRSFPSTCGCISI